MGLRYELHICSTCLVPLQPDTSLEEEGVEEVSAVEDVEVVSEEPTTEKNTPGRRRRRGCGCNKRKKWLNDLAPSLKLGDKVEAVTEATGVKSVVEKVFGKDEETSEQGEQQVRLPLKWAYGITTVPERYDTYFPKTLESLRLAGFDNPRLFIDGCNDTSQYSALGLEITTRYPRIRTAGNWVLSLYELYYREPNADRYAVFQDDFVTYKNLRGYLEALPYPAEGGVVGGYCNLYTFPSNQSILPKNSNGWFKSNQMGKGAVALVFSNEAVRVLLSSRHLADRPMDAMRGWRAIDGGIVDSFKKAGWVEYVHNPSLVQHLGDVSSMGNRQQPKSVSFLGSETDAMTLLPK